MMIIDFVFYLGVSLLLTHELDAVRRGEWRIFPGLSGLKEDLAYHLFVILHIPLFILLLWLMCHPSEHVRFWFQLSLDAFLIIHLGLHYLFKSHQQYEFTGLFSKIIINTAALAGLIHILLLINNKNA